jgi:hypothetical protein
LTTIGGEDDEKKSKINTNWRGRENITGKGIHEQESLASRCKFSDPSGTIFELSLTVFILFLTFVYREE